MPSTSVVLTDRGTQRRMRAKFPGHRRENPPTSFEYTLPASR